MRFKKLSDKLKAIILAGVTLIPTGGCGKNELSNNPGIVKPGANVSVSDDKGDDTTITEETTTGVFAENGTTAYYVSDEWGTSILDTTDVVTSGLYSSKVNGGKTTKTTPVLNETTTAYGDETTNYKDETTRLGEETTRLTEETTRVYNTTGSNKITTSKTTPKVTTNTTRGTITTNKTTTTTTTKKNNGSGNYKTAADYGLEEDELLYKFDRISSSCNAFDYYSDFLKKDLLYKPGYFFVEYMMPYGRTDGGSESQLLLYLLNYKYVPLNVANSRFNYSLDYNSQVVYNAKSFVYNIGNLQKKFNHKVDFRKYTFDVEMGQFLNEMEDAYFNGKIRDFLKEQYVNKKMKKEYMTHPGFISIAAGYSNGIITPEIADSICMDNIVNDFMSEYNAKKYTK